jgi:ATP/maltotriose-dependent transcriptional regulator MalT
LLANNSAVALSSLGRYDDVARLLDSTVLLGPVDETLYARLTRAEVHLAQGNFAAAQHLLDDLRGRPHQDPRFVAPLYACLADTAAWQGQLEQAREMVIQGRQAIADTDAARAVVQLTAVGLRICADMRDSPWADELIVQLPVTAEDRPHTDETGLLVRQCHAERARAEEGDTAEVWRQIAAGWAALQQPFRKAYALGRAAAAAARAGDREQANAAIREAYAIAEAIGTEPLREQLHTLAGEWKLRVSKPTPHNLTHQEMKVLKVLATGASNADIATTLTIAPGTVSTHVSNILRKLKVSNRNEAAALARREGLAG